MTPTPDPIKTILYNHELRTGVDLGDEIDRESLEQAINNELLRARISELMEMPKTSDYVIARHLAERITKLEAAIKSSGA